MEDGEVLLVAFRRLVVAGLVVLFTATPGILRAADLPAGSGSVELSGDERRWLAAHPVIRFAADPDYQPIESIDQDGRLVGMSVDYLRLLETKLGIRFWMVPVSSWDAAMAKARNREVDMLSAATKSVARTRHLAFTTPHIELPGVIIVRSATDGLSRLHQLREKKVGVVSSYIWQEWIANDHPTIDLQPVRDMQTGLLLVSFGQLDAMVGNVGTATHFIEKLGITNLRVTGETGYFARLAIASRNDWPILNAVLQKAVSAITPAEKKAIQEKWIKLDRSWFFDFRKILLGLLVIAVIFVVAVAGGLVWNNSLRRMVRRQSASLLESEDRYRRLVEASADGLLVAGPEGVIEFANSAAVNLFRAQSVERLTGMNNMELIDPDDRDDVEPRRVSILAGEVLPFVERRRVRLDGTTFQSESRGVPFTWKGGPAILITVRDITERRLAEERLRQAQRMEAVGQLTGGVAHDFNNLLTVILGNAEILTNRLGGGRPAEAVVRAAQRGAELTQRLLAFSRRQPLSPKIIDMNDLIGGMADMLRRTLGATIKIETRGAADLWSIDADPGQLENAILNLAINARDAMPAGGTLILDTANLTLDRAAETHRLNIASGDYAVLSVTDTGAGMNADALEHAFEPFFTTKDIGQGSGLGLSMVHGFIHQSGGGVAIESGRDRGTTVKLYLPRAEHGDVRSAPADDARDTPGAQGETVLLVEDEPDVMLLTAALLRDIGYTVVEARDGAEAIEEFDNAPHVDLLLCDVVLPGGMSGPALAAKIRLRDATAKVLFFSGYAGAAAVGAGQSIADAGFLDKPFTRKDLARMVRSVLDGETGNGKGEKRPNNHSIAFDSTS